MWTAGPAMAIAAAFPIPVPPPVIQMTFLACIRDRAPFQACLFTFSKASFVLLAAGSATSILPCVARNGQRSQRGARRALLAAKGDRGLSRAGPSSHQHTAAANGRRLARRLQKAPLP